MAEREPQTQLTVVPQAKPARRRLKTRPPAHEEGEGNWLISYADMMTLLVGFFIVLLSFSKVDQGEFEKIRKATTLVFGGEYKLPFEELSKKLKKVIEDQKLENQVFINETALGIDITFRGALFFDSGSVLLRDEAKKLLTELIPEISANAIDFGIVVEGHTDNRPIVGGLFASNWELSSVRACTVLRLFEDKGFNPKKMKALGWGEQRPLLPNEDEKKQMIPDNQAQNRRVVVKILKEFE